MLPILTHLPQLPLLLLLVLLVPSTLLLPHPSCRRHESSSSSSSSSPSSSFFFFLSGHQDIRLHPSSESSPSSEQFWLEYGPGGLERNGPSCAAISSKCPRDLPRVQARGSPWSAYLAHREGIGPRLLSRASRATAAARVAAAEPRPTPAVGSHLHCPPSASSRPRLVALPSMDGAPRCGAGGVAAASLGSWGEEDPGPLRHSDDMGGQRLGATPARVPLGVYGWSLLGLWV